MGGVQYKFLLHYFSSSKSKVHTHTHFAKPKRFYWCPPQRLGNKGTKC